MSTPRFRLGALALGGLLAVTSLAMSPAAAFAHEGHDHGDEVAATTWANYERVTLSRDVGEPIDLAVLPDSRVLHTTRAGQVRLTDPAQGTTTTVNTIDVYANSEDGLQTVTLDPDFEENGWVYLYYAPRVMEAPYPATTPTGSAPNTLPAGADASYWDQWKGYNQLSRFKWNEETDSLDLSTQQDIIRVEVQRGQCCHVAGDVAFDNDGNLLLATGDNTPAGTPGANGYAPNNDRPGYNPGFDARRGAGNTNDLRGKILRIDVQEDGSYAIPAGNLFAPGTADTRPEIFVMGLRNPFRIDVDPATGAVTWGDYGPDAGTANDLRGPMGYVEWQSTTTALNGGWPYCHGPNANYNDWDFETATQGPWFDCEGTLLNTSAYNTGLDQLPTATAPQIWYGDRPEHQPWPEFGSGGQAPMGGPTYRYDAENPSTTKFPAYWDGKAFMGEFSRDRVFAFSQDDPNGPVTKIEDFLPNSALSAAGMPIWDNPMDLEFGPDGSLYVLDYGDGFFRPNPDSGLYRVDYVEGTKGPRVVLDASVTSGEGPLTVEFDASESTHPDGLGLSFAWDFTGSGTFTEGEATASHTFAEDGQYQARVRVTDDGGRVSLASVTITVGNTAPVVEIISPANGAFTDWGDQVAFEVKVTDPDETIDCSRVLWSYGLGHDNTHTHPLFTGSGCTATIETSLEAGHGETENIYGQIGASYTDAGTDTAPSLAGDAVALLNPRALQAEHSDARSGELTVVDDETAAGFRHLSGLGAGEWIAYNPVELGGITGVELRAKGAGTVALHWADAEGEIIAEFDLDSADAWQEVSVPLTVAPEGTGRVVVTSTGGVDLDQVEFTTSTSDIRSLLAVLAADKRITNGAKSSFGDTLTEIDAALAAGDTATAISKLEFIVAQVPNRIRTDADAAALVIRAAEAVIADLTQLTA